ncbi:hypothetical protein N0K71_06685 [Dellaglioa algida]|uniref:Uncharacterized protein n=1 Tax=Dellaglioa algida DSM 15638 TaxID=1423719 RepID=A0A0R1HG08_9LACO|nr:hypothetical protein [Dellaglioa algida]KRK45350.1 hypothetical protein FC66_GL001466 [Dellaglioa algida DSM 15638]MDK1733310.1 hypothetical protein [Dellaglioa algida]MDK1734773.1 hypothetical protein [Dellaglioa algida]
MNPNKPYVEFFELTEAYDNVISKVLLASDLSDESRIQIVSDIQEAINKIDFDVVSSIGEK